MTVVTRFPPSPTGFMHIGNARTALYNWLFARHHGGKFLLRIEDTDRTRHSEEAVGVIMEGMKWLELDWDGDVVSQFAGREHHADIARQLVEKGQAYYCYCSPEELEDMRNKAKEEGTSSFYDRRWRTRDISEAPEGIKPVIRIKAPIDGATTIEDKVQGSVTVKNDTLDDFIILRSDGTPTYMLSVVVDDHDMGVTHILRGDDHLNNAFRQKIIYDAMGWDTPVFAHLPLIHGPDGGKFSKRHGATSVDEYKDMGYLPEAMRNYLLRLGWSHGDDEIIPTEKALEWFNIESIGKSPARFDFAKLDSINTHYIAHSTNEYLLDAIAPLFADKYQIDIKTNDTFMHRLGACMDELKSRAKTLNQLVDEAAFLVKSIPYDFDEKAFNILSDGSIQVLEAIYNQVQSLDKLTNDNVQELCKSVASDFADGKLGKVAMPLRAALTGTTVSPSIFHAAEILGKDEVLERLSYVMHSLKEEKLKKA